VIGGIKGTRMRLIFCSVRLMNTLKRVTLPLFLVAVVCGCGQQSTKVVPHALSPPHDLSSLLVLEQEELADVDIARMNVLCAQGLPGAERIDVDACLATLDAMAQRVQSETARHHYRFRRNPTEYEGSEGFYRMLMLAVVLAEDFRVHYNPAKATSAAQAGVRDGFFADSQDVFLHGLAAETRMGTCSSLPVLHVAVGRRLGYPLKLVATKGHLFVRWEDAQERFNVEVTGQGLNRFDDDYYRHWPMPVSESEVQAEGYLKSMTPMNELAAFLSIRGMCWQEVGNARLAAESFREAVRLTPTCRSYRMMLAKLDPASNVGSENSKR